MYPVDGNRELQPPAIDREHSVEEVKSIEEEKPSAWDFMDLENHVRSHKGTESSAGDGDVIFGKVEIEAFAGGAQHSMAWEDPADEKPMISTVPLKMEVEKSSSSQLQQVSSHTVKLKKARSNLPAIVISSWILQM
ncbi:hypothetical protein NDU88_000003 [Pleurodeles waltl]|uniref:Uncharacterized protein n=1 Tax=Pleurodeles waltl TaxID=8319 RepID=A0AAV7KLD6_PLEWA|nr:hypothetical protein NDU88_000003 [Pleurodeles waltl]